MASLLSRSRRSGDRKRVAGGELCPAACAEKPHFVFTRRSRSRHLPLQAALALAADVAEIDAPAILRALGKEPDPILLVRMRELAPGHAHRLARHGLRLGNRDLP